MSPKKFKKLKELRKSLDILDNSFIKLIKKRTILVNENKRRNSQSSFIKFDALARSSLTQSATKKDIPKKIKS